MSQKKLNVAIVGATGAVGRELLKILESRKFPVGDLVPFASVRSEGQKVSLGSRSFSCQVLRKGCFKGIDMAFFDASDAISKEWVPEAAEAGAWVIDNSATYRMEKDIPLVVPEVNGNLVASHMKSKLEGSRNRIFSGPNCSTVQMVVALKPILENWGLKRVVVSTYQSTSGAGSAAMEELKVQTGRVLQGSKAEAKAFVHPIPFNCIPHIGGFKDDGYTSEEQKLMLEARKILGLPGLKITATAIRVPTLSCHSESVNVETEKPFEISAVRAALEKQDGLLLQDDPSKNHYPMGAVGTGQDPVYVGRLRRDASIENGLNLWVVSDNLRKGAALNAVQIGESILENF
jgi:aspartate-semialdehyde dehydrogenase